MAQNMLNIFNNIRNQYQGSMLSSQAVPKLAEGVRVSWDDGSQSSVLLYPEGMIVLNRELSKLLTLCDGRRTMEQILIGLKSAGFSSADKTHVLADMIEMVSSGLVTLEQAG